MTRDLSGIIHLVFPTVESQSTPKPGYRTSTALGMARGHFRFLTLISMVVSDDFSPRGETKPMLLSCYHPLYLKNTSIPPAHSAQVK